MNPFKDVTLSANLPEEDTSEFKIGDSVHIKGIGDGTVVQILSSIVIVDYSVFDNDGNTISYISGFYPSQLELISREGSSSDATLINLDPGPVMQIPETVTKVEPNNLEKASILAKTVLPSGPELPSEYIVDQNV